MSTTRRLLLVVASIMFMAPAASASSTPGPKMDCAGHHAPPIHFAYMRKGYSCTEVPDSTAKGDSYNYYRMARHDIVCPYPTTHVFEATIKPVKNGYEYWHGDHCE